MVMKRRRVAITRDTAGADSHTIRLVHTRGLAMECSRVAGDIASDSSPVRLSSCCCSRAIIKEEMRARVMVRACDLLLSFCVVIGVVVRARVLVRARHCCQRGCPTTPPPHH